MPGSRATLASRVSRASSNRHCSMRRPRICTPCPRVDSTLCLTQWYNYPASASSASSRLRSLAMDSRTDRQSMLAPSFWSLDGVASLLATISAPFVSWTGRSGFVGPAPPQAVWFRASAAETSASVTGSAATTPHFAGVIAATARSTCSRTISALAKKRAAHSPYQELPSLFPDGETVAAPLVVAQNRSLAGFWPCHEPKSGIDRPQFFLRSPREPGESGEVLPRGRPRPRRGPAKVTPPRAGTRARRARAVMGFAAGAAGVRPTATGARGWRARRAGPR